MVVRVLSAQEQDGLLRVSLHVLATSAGRPLRIGVGQSVEVSARREGGWNQIWRLYPLEADALEPALEELEAAYRVPPKWEWCTTAAAEEP